MVKVGCLIEYIRESLKRHLFLSKTLFILKDDCKTANLAKFEKLLLLEEFTQFRKRQDTVNKFKQCFEGSRELQFVNSETIDFSTTTFQSFSHPLKDINEFWDSFALSLYLLPEIEKISIECTFILKIKTHVYQSQQLLRFLNVFNSLKRLKNFLFVATHILAKDIY